MNLCQREHQLKQNNLMAEKFDNILRNTIVELITERDKLKALVAEKANQNVTLANENCKLIVQVDEKNQLIDYLKQQISCQNGTTTIAQSFIDITRSIVGDGVDSNFRTTPTQNESIEAVPEDRTKRPNIIEIDDDGDDAANKIVTTAVDHNSNTN